MLVFFLEGYVIGCFLKQIMQMLVEVQIFMFFVQLVFVKVWRDGVFCDEKKMEVQEKKLGERVRVSFDIILNMEDNIIDRLDIYIYI